MKIFLYLSILAFFLASFKSTLLLKPQKDLKNTPQDRKLDIIQNFLGISNDSDEELADYDKPIQMNKL